MKTSRREKLQVILGMVAVVTALEIPLRILGPSIPQPLRWPSIESDIKFDQMELLSGTPIAAVFLGDSAMESGVDPGQLQDLGVQGTSYNAALPWATPAAMELWYRAVVVPLLSPHAVVVGLAPTDGVTSMDEDVLLEGLKESVEDQASTGLLEATTETLELVRRRTMIRELPEILVRHKARQLGLISDLGFQSGYLRGLIGATGRSDANAKPVAALSADSAKAIEDLVRGARAEGSEVLLLILPLPCPGTSECGTGGLSVYSESVAELGRRLGVEVVDANQQAWPADLFVDDRHLNSSGVHRFQQLVARSLLANAYLQTG